MSRQKGFTLIELMIVIAIIGILAIIAIPRFVDLVDKAREGATKGNLGAIRGAIVIFYGDNEGRYPLTLDTRRSEWPGYTARPFVTDYIEVMPEAKLRRGHPGADSRAVTYGATPTTTGGWLYNATTGAVMINSTGLDSKGIPYSSY